MQKIHTYRALVDVVEEFYASNTDPEERWPLPMLKSALVIADATSRGVHRHVAIAACAYLTLSEFERETFANAYEIPPAVQRALEDGPSWPEPVTVAGYDTATPVELEAYRSYALSAVEELSHEVRLELVTSLPGQDMIYLRKETEARAYLALETGPADLTDFPLMSFEVGITAPTPLELAQLWVVMSDAWVAAAGPLEAARQTAKIALLAATDVASMTTALDDFRATLA